MSGSDPAVERRVLDLFQAALDLPEDERAAWVEAQSDAGSTLRMRLMAMLAGDRLANLRTGGAIDLVEDEVLPERIGAYRIVARIGRGGMGAVYRGERMTGDFAHVAAIKVIKQGLLSDKLIERFQRERQTLANLEHPYIARLYDGGETQVGAPFIVMEYVDGEPLLDWADSHELVRDDRLRLFEHICEAVSHAHRSLIIHRDITPSNVLVTLDGTVKLIDFGIAQPTGDGVMSTSRSIASLTLTPGFAAPERTNGGEATTASDTYSLGKLLEALVPPAGDPELGAIVARATAIGPDDRYPTADALRADIAALRAELPVVAVAGGRRYLARKFVQRHRFGVIAAAAALALLFGAFAGTLWALDRAQAARTQAEARFDQTRAIAKTMLFDVYSEVSKTPGGTKARELLARTGLTYLNALAGDPQAPIDVRTEVALGYVRLAQVVGGGQASQLGKLADANDLIAKAEAILATIPVERRGDAPVVRAFATVQLEKAGNDLYTNNEIARARAGAIETQRIMLPFARTDEDSARLYATAIQTEGDSYGWDDDYARALPIHQRAEAFIAALPSAFRDSLGVMKVRSANMRLLGESMHRTKDDVAAIGALDRAVTMNEALLKAAPDDPAIMRKLAQSLWYRAVLLREVKRLPDAATSIDRAVGIARVMQARDPNDQGALTLYTLTAEVQAQVLADQGRAAESGAVSDAVIAAHRRLVILANNAPGRLRSMAAAMDTRGGNFYNGGAYGRACQAWGEALAVYRDLDNRKILTEFDRSKALKPLVRRMAQTCNPPHAGLTE